MITVPLTHEAGAPERAERVPPVDDLARVACDVAPASGNDGPDRIFGAWADELDAAIPADRSALILATAAACFFPPDDDTLTPFESWSRRSPAPPAADRAMFRAVARAPWAIRRITSLDPVRSVDATGLAGPWTPGDDLAIAPIASLVAPQVGDALLVRAVRGKDGGWTAALALVVPGFPPAEAIAAWVADVVAQSGGLTVERALARHGQVLVRRACERAWAERRRNS